ncbi:MAG TPA: PEGA domain-containing protein [Acidobacteriota bacterium]|nr:PEGA domain-containing protein [Acidobacteriota bacterium]
MKRHVHPPLAIGRAAAFILMLAAASAGNQLAASEQWAVVIGISEFQLLPEEQWLNYAHSDARSFADVLKSRRVGVPPENLRLLLNRQATTRNVKHVLGSWLRDRVEPKDTVYLYIASHGVVTKRKEAYFITYDTDPASLYATGFPMAELRRVLSELPARNLIVASDACKSGNVGPELFDSRDLEMPSINDHFKELVPQDGQGSFDASGLADENSEIQPSRFVLTAAGSFEKSFESEQWGGGVFTHFLVEGLRGLADRDRNGRVNANELYDYVRENVRNRTDNKQNPMVIGSEYDGRLVLAVAPGAVGPTTVPFSADALPATKSAAAKAADSSTKGALLISANVGGVRWTIDNVVQPDLASGERRLLHLPPGGHTLTAQKDGFHLHVASAAVPPGQQIAVELRLEPEVLTPDLTPRLDDLIERYKVGEPTVAGDLEEIVDEVAAIHARRALLPEERRWLEDAVALLVDRYTSEQKSRKLSALIDKCIKSFSFFPYALTVGRPIDRQALVGEEIGFLRLRLQPRAAHLEIDSSYYGLLPEGQSDILLATGPHDIRLHRDGFLPQNRHVEVMEFDKPPDAAEAARRAGPTSLELEVSLQLEALDVFVFADSGAYDVASDPPGEVSLVALSSLLPLLRPGQQEILRTAAGERGLNASAWVASLRVRPSEAGPLALTFSRPRHATHTTQLPLGDEQVWKDAALSEGVFVAEDTVRLDPLLGTLNVSTQPEGAQVMAGGEELGATPLEKELPVGEYELRLRKGKLRHRQTLTIEEGQVREIDVRLKPPLVFLGTHSPQLEPERTAEIERRIRDHLPQIFTHYAINYQDPSKYEYTLDFLRQSFSPGKSGAIGSALHLQALRDRFDSDLFLFAYFPSERDFLANRLSFLLFSTLSSRADRRVVDAYSAQEISRFLTVVDSTALRPEDLFRADLGLQTIDTLLKGRELTVAVVDPQGPAAQAGLQSGEAIVRVDGQAATSSSLKQTIQSKPAGSSFRLEVRRASGETATLPVVSRTLPRLMPASAGQALLNGLLLQLDLLLEEAAPGLARNIVLLNMARVYMELEDWQSAIEALNRIGVDQPDSRILKAAVAYLRGFGYEHLDELELARQAYRRATGDDSVALTSNLGFAFQDLAQWRLDYLR